jgi:hypothetical protein
VGYATTDEEVILIVDQIDGTRKINTSLVAWYEKTTGSDIPVWRCYSDRGVCPGVITDEIMAHIETVINHPMIMIDNGPGRPIKFQRSKHHNS